MYIIYIYIYKLFSWVIVILYIYSFSLIIVTSKNSHPIINMFQVNDKETRTS